MPGVFCNPAFTDSNMARLNFVFPNAPGFRTRGKAPRGEFAARTGVILTSYLYLAEIQRARSGL